MLSVEHLTVRFGSHQALDDVDLRIGDAELVCALGPSGSGKSTLLRTIAGLEIPEEGRILRDGRDLAGVPTHQRRVGLMFQDHALFPHRDVLGNVVFGLRMQGASRGQAEARARTTLTRVGLAGFEHRAVHELSGGEQQRVALARALAPSPSLVMLDEPLGALDRALRERLVDELGSVFRALGVSALLVTHDHDEAFALGDRVAILHEGRLEQVGTPVELWHRPATAFVAEFLGWNVTEAFGPLRVGIRPDALRIAADGRVAATVLSRTFRRDHWRIRVALDRAPDGATLDVEVRGDAPPETGTAVRLAVDDAALVPLLN